MIAPLVLRTLDRVDTEQRRLWAARILLWSVAGWLVSHVLLAWLGQGTFFTHVLLALSWGAVVLTSIDVVVTSDVRDQQDTTL